MSFGPITFTGTSGDTLTAYDANWERLSGDTGTILISSAQRARRGTAGQTTQYTFAGWTPASADYEVEADFVVMNTSTTERFGILGRASNTSRRFYLARFTAGSTTATIALMKAVDASPTIITSVTKTVATNDVLKIRLSMSGSTIKVFIDDVEEISVTDTSVTAAGRMGLYYTSDSSTPSNSVGVHIDNLSGLEADAGRVVDFSNTVANASISSDSSVAVVSSLSISLDGNAIASSASETILTDLTKTLDSVTLAATIPDSGSVQADLNLTLADATLTSATTEISSAEFSSQLSNVSLSSALVADLTIASTLTVDSISVVTSVAGEITGTASLVLSGVALSSTVSGEPSSDGDLDVVLDGVVVGSAVTSVVSADLSKSTSASLNSASSILDTVSLNTTLAGMSITATIGDVPDRQVDLVVTLGNVIVVASVIPRIQPTPVAKRTIRISDFRN